MSTAFARHRRKIKLKSEINVVPYIDVMLVLLIIFMVTAPLLNLGVDIDLPQSNARSVESKKEPIVVSVDAAALVEKVRAFYGNNHDVAVFVAGDGKASYETIYQAMVLLQTAGVDKVGLMSKPVEGH